MLPMRPRFELVVPFPPEEVVSRLHSQLACAGCPCQAAVAERTVEVRIAERLQHTWSPYLTFAIEPHPDGAALHGLFGPNPNVWTSVLAAYGFLGLSAAFGGMFGLAQVVVKEWPWGLVVAGGALVACVLPYLASLVGQRLAAEQMHLLRCFLSASLGLETPPPSEEARPPSVDCPPDATPRALPTVDRAG